MSEAPGIPGSDGDEPGYRERLRLALAAAADLFSTRAEILGEEASQKAVHLCRGLGGLAVAVATGSIALLLLAALIAALLALLFGSTWAGILAALLLYAGAAAAGGFFGWRALRRVRPFDFPVTRAELRKDWETLRRSLDPGQESEAAPGDPASLSSSSLPALDDVEARFRAGSE